VLLCLQTDRILVSYVLNLLMVSSICRHQLNNLRPISQCEILRSSDSAASRQKHRKRPRQLLDQGAQHGDRFTTIGSVVHRICGRLLGIISWRDCGVGQCVRDTSI
jgi:hypothetical protein